MTKTHIPQKLRRLVRERAQGYCEYCICPDSHATQTHSHDHVFPEDLGGKTTEENLALACQGCNNGKYNKTHAPDPETQQIVPLFHPRQDNWHAHFTWNEEGLLLVGQTPTGRATIAALDLNRAGVVNFRRLLKLAGQYPPTHRSASE